MHQRPNFMSMYLVTVCLAWCLDSVLNVKGAFNQEKALVGALSVIVKTDCETDWALHSTKHSAAKLRPGNIMEISRRPQRWLDIHKFLFWIGNIYIRDQAGIIHDVFFLFCNYENVDRTSSNECNDNKLDNFFRKHNIYKVKARFRYKVFSIY